MDTIEKILELEKRLAAQERLIRELLVRTGNLPARWAHLPTLRPIPLQVTKVAQTGRAKYEGKIITYSTNAANPPLLTTASAGTPLEFFNRLEGSNGTPFLAIGDEVDVWRQGEVIVCSEIPRGFV